MPKVRTKKKKWLKEQDEEEPEVFSVEQIKGKRIGAEGKVEYYLKWMNYPDSDNTWEPEDNLDCPELIEAYEKRMKGSHGGASSSSTVDATSNPVPRKGAEKVITDRSCCLHIGSLSPHFREFHCIQRCP